MSMDIITLTISHGMNLRKAKRICDALGISYAPIRGTGEQRFFFPGRPLTVSCGRKCAPRELTLRLRRFIRRLRDRR